MPIAALVALVLQNLPAIISVGQAGIAFIARIRSAAQQSSEWPPEAEAAFTDALLQDALAPEWQPDKK
jgi:hypothetical protein